MNQDKLKSIIESLLFVSGEPIKISRLVKISGAPKPEIENAIMALSSEYESQNRGLRIVKKENQVQMATGPESAPYVQQLIEGKLQEELSTASLEVVSIVAYRGPITRANIESIRGVNCSYTLRNLLMRGLIDRTENPKDARGYVYSISFDFLKKLGIDDVKKLPDHEIMSKDERIDNIIQS
ncbi:segregation and condensation protein B [bacterium BMS3Abin15]|nr:segregation and condensation protein B [bacterium BMS3Abin15]